MTLPSHAWCRQLAEAKADDLGAILRDMAVRLFGPYCELLHAREPWEGEHGTHWFLHVALVTDHPEATDPAWLARECAREFDPFTGRADPIVHVYAPNDPRVKRYHRVGPNVPRPVLQKPQERPAPPPAPDPAPAPALASPVAPKPTRKPPTQGSLF